MDSCLCVLPDAVAEGASPAPPRGRDTPFSFFLCLEAGWGPQGSTRPRAPSVGQRVRLWGQFKISLRSVVTQILLFLRWTASIAKADADFIEGTR